MTVLPCKKAKASQQPQYPLETLLHLGHLPGAEGREGAAAEAVEIQGSGLVDYDLAGLEQAVAGPHRDPPAFEGGIDRLKSAAAQKP
jgi:hypothetical protein